MTASKRYGSKVQLNHLQNGDISYFITYKTNKKTVFKKVGKKSEGINEAKAIELRNQILSEIRHGIDLSQKSIKTLSFQKLADIYFSCALNEQPACASMQRSVPARGCEWIMRRTKEK